MSIKGCKKVGEFGSHQPGLDKFFFVPMHFFKWRFPSFEGTIICSLGDRKESANGEHFPVGKSSGSTWMNSTSPVGLGAWGPLGHGDPHIDQIYEEWYGCFKWWEISGNRDVGSFKLQTCLKLFSPWFLSKWSNIFKLAETTSQTKYLGCIFAFQQWAKPMYQCFIYARNS